jgi:hypothetical protein
MKKTILFLVMAVALTTQTLFAQVPSYVPTNGLVGYWPFNGNANDISGNGNNGTNNGATLTTDRNGNVNSAYYFSSSGCSTRIDAQINTSSIQSGLTISVWVLKVNDGCSSARLFEFWPGNNGPGQAVGWWGNPNPNNIIGIGHTTSNGTVCDYGYPAVSNNVWTHLIYTNDGVKARFYQDGIFKGEVNSSGNVNLASSLAIGRMNHPSFDAFNGKIDDFGIWNRALTQQEITNIYNSSLPQTACLPANVPTTGLVGYWPFCGNANDESGNGNNGTNNGATLTTDRFGNSNSAYSFNGTNNFIELVNSAQLDNMNDFSISTWYQVNNTSPQFQFLVSKDLMGDPPNGDWDFYVNYNKVKFDITINTNNNSGTQNSLIEPNTWNHALITRNSLSGLINIYINGVLENSFTGYIGPYSNTQKMNFGRQGSSNQHFLNGKLDDIGIWNRALTQEEITNLYNVNQCITNITVTDTLIINVGQLSFNDPVTWANNITIAPNPASSQININFNNITNLNGGTLKVINSMGQEVATTPITTSGTNSTMQLSTWGGTGMYFVQIINPQGQIVDIKKIILQ